MTWAYFDDGAPKHPKAVAAGNDAWALWAAAVMYCNRWLTDGVITLGALASDCLPEPISKPKARKLAEKLCGVKLRPDGMGLFEATEQADTYLVHDFLDWNKSKAEVESKRAADRARKRGGGTPQGGSDPPSSPGGFPPEGGADSARKANGIPSGKSSDSASRADARGRSLSSLPSRPVPPAAAERRQPEENGRVRCPMPVPVPEETLVSLELSVGLPVAVARAFLVTWSPRQNARAGDLRPVDTWCATAVSALTGEWSKDKAAMRAAAGVASPADDEAAKRLAAMEAQRTERLKRQSEDAARILAERGQTPVRDVTKLVGGIGG